MRAILWARVSDPRRQSEEDEKRGRRQSQQDVENQLIALRDLGKRLGWEIVEEVRVEGSAWKQDPPEKQQLLDRLALGGVDLVAVWSIDRWTRNEPYLALEEIVRLEKHLGIHIFSLKEPWLSTTDPGLRQVLITLFSWIAEYESSKRSERVKAAVTAKRARAGNIGRNAKWGKGKIPSTAEIEEMRALHNEDPTKWSYAALGKKFGYAKSTAYAHVKGPPAAGADPGPATPS
jgi:DNA invertase Pin-like site-specific DNA recombinase